MRRHLMNTLVALAALQGLPGALAQTALSIPGIGTMRDIPGAKERPDPALDYKVVFDMRTIDGSARQVNDAITSIAGLVNTFSRYGVPAGHMHFVAVFHGPTILLVANDATYRTRTGVPSNPNVSLLQELVHAGVQLVVCGQSALAQHYDAASLLPFAQMNLSATVTFINLQTRGYVRVEE